MAGAVGLSISRGIAGWAALSYNLSALHYLGSCLP